MQEIDLKFESRIEERKKIESTKNFAMTFEFVQDKTIICSNCNFPLKIKKFESEIQIRKTYFQNEIRQQRPGPYFNLL